MQKIELIILMIITIIICGMANPEEIERILQKPEEEIDVGYACLLLSKDAFPDIDINQGLKVFDNMSRDVSTIIKMSNDTTSL